MSGNSGVIKQVMGPVVDVEFPKVNSSDLQRT